MQGVGVGAGGEEHSDDSAPVAVDVRPQHPAIVSSASQNSNSGD